MVIHPCIPVDADGSHGRTSWVTSGTRHREANAGADDWGNIGEGRFEAHRAVVDVNLLGAMATIDAAVAHFRSKGGGQVKAHA